MRVFDRKHRIAAPRAAMLAGSLALVFAVGCKPVGPDYKRPEYQAPASYKETGGSAVIMPPPNPAGGGWHPANPSDGMLRGNWWEVYQDPQLNRLEERVEADNPSLRQALETYLAAREAVSAVRANYYPFISGDISFSRGRVSQHRPNGSGAVTSETNDLAVGGQASWEPDIWGRVRRSVEAARDNAQADAAITANLKLSLQAELATDYFALRGSDAQSRLLTTSVNDLEHQLDLTQQRFSGGVVTAVDVEQARTQLETVRAALVDVGLSRAQFEHAIGTIANYNLPDFSIPPSPLDMRLPNVPTGVPSQLLERRPDIATAERHAAAANAQIGIAVSAFYPTISLGASGGFESTSPGTWIQGPSSLWSLGAQATQLLFDAGQRRALTSEARHNYESQVAGYRNTVLVAFNDVEDQLSGLRILEQESGVEQRAVESAQRSFDLSNQRYRGGVTSYLEVLTAETTLIQNQRTVIDLQTRRFLSSVGLIRALGGGWDVTQLP
jgi:NodT family efflux transporter outer membrane factor (OMF) lipoprotein